MSFINIVFIVVIICIVIALILSLASQYVLLSHEEYKRLKQMEENREAERTATKFEVSNLNRQLVKAKDEQQRWFAAFAEAQRELEELRKKDNGHL